MRYCTNCRHFTAGEPLYCSSCGRTYDVKLCPSRHPNPRSAQVCSQCGSREFSMPQPQRSFKVRALLWLLRMAPGVILWLLTVVVAMAAIRKFLYDPQAQRDFIAVGLVIGILWYLYLQLPASFRKSLSTKVNTKEGQRNGHTER